MVVTLYVILGEQLYTLTSSVKNIIFNIAAI